jgi:hypothetical protein
MEFQDVVRRRRMVRRYDPSRAVPPDLIDHIVRNGLRAPSAGFSQGWGFLVLDNPADVARFRDVVRPEGHPHAPPGKPEPQRRKIDEERLRLARGTHQLLHLVYGSAARQLGHAADISGPGAGRRGTRLWLL